MARLPLEAPQALEGVSLAPLFGFALVHLLNGSTGKALVVARGLQVLAPAVPRYQALLCACLLAENQPDAAEPLVMQMQSLPDGGGRQIALSTQMLAALIHWHRGRARDGEAALRRCLIDAQLC